MKLLRDGDEVAFQTLVKQNYSSMLRLATTIVGNRALAEDVVQETWLGVLRGLSAFEGRSSLKTWIYRILMNRARSKAVSENRLQTMFPHSGGTFEPDEPGSTLELFSPDGQWISYPSDWKASPERQLLSKETLAVLDRAVRELPCAQRAVLELRDVEGFHADEVCEILGISGVNQRVTLHRARSKVRRTLSEHLERFQ